MGIAAAIMGLSILGIFESSFGSIQGLESLNGAKAQKLGYILLPIGLAISVLTLFGFRYALPKIRRNKSGEPSPLLRDELRDRFKGHRR